MKLLFRFIIGLLIVVYPLAIYFGLQIVEPKYLALLLAVVIVLRFILPSGAQMTGSKSTAIMTLAGLFIAMLGWISNQTDALLFYPVIINAGLFTVFFISLLHPPTVIERLARLQQPDLPESGIIYTRKVTQIWLGFFLLNGSLALITALYANIEIWTLYNGLIAYILMGTLFVSEWCYRKWILQKD